MDIYGIRCRCQYFKCKNGRYNSTKLFRIPLNSERQKIWVECAGNPLLKTYKSVYLNSLSLCIDHFLDRDILNAPSGLRLRKGANPIHWKEAVTDSEMVEHEATEVEQIEEHQNTQSDVDQELENKENDKP